MFFKESGSVKSLWMRSARDGRGSWRRGAPSIAAAAAVAAVGMVGFPVPAYAAGTCTVTQGTNFDNQTKLQDLLTNVGVATTSGATTGTGTCGAGSADALVVEFGSGTFTLTSQLTYVDAGASLTLNGLGSNYSAIDANGSSIAKRRILSSYDTSRPVTISNLTLKNGYVSANGNSGSGGAILAGGPVTVTNATFTNNIVASPNGGWSGFGGAIAVFGQPGGVSIPVEITGSTFQSNSSTFGGGAVWLHPYFSTGAPTITIRGSEFNDNVVTSGSGGAVLAGGSSPRTSVIVQPWTSVSSYFRRNKALGGSASGGAIYATGNIEVLGASNSSVQFTQNGFVSTAIAPRSVGDETTYGGALVSEGDVTVTGNSATSRILFDGNQALYGGAIAARQPNSHISVTLANFSNQKASGTIGGLGNVGDGGVIYADQPGVTVDLIKTQIVTSATMYGTGAAVFADDATPQGTIVVNVDYSTIWNNTAGGTGSVGGVRTSGTLNATNSTFYANAGASYGSAFSDGPATLSFVTASSAAGNGLEFKSGAGLTAQGSAIVGTCSVAGVSVNTHSFSTDASCPGTLTTQSQMDLATPADTGGPTSTMLPSSSSLLIGKVPAAAWSGMPSDDQRLVARSGGMTAGAVQVAGATDATLSGLVASGGVLAPSFASGTLAYSASVGNGVASTTITPTTTHSGATVTVNGTTVASGVASSPVALAEGLNVINVVVTAQDGTTAQTYTVTITRASSGGGGGSGGSSGSSTPTPTQTSPTVVTPAGPGSLGPVEVPSVTGLRPGGSIVLVGGQQTSSITVPNTGTGSVTSSGAGWSVTAGGQTASGSAQPLTATGVVQIPQGGSVRLSGGGYQPGASVQVYGINPGLLLGTIPVDSNGNFSGSVTLPPSFSPGNAVVQVNGYTPTASVRSLSLGVRVVKDSNSIVRKLAATVYFAEGSSRLDAKAQATLDKLVKSVPRGATSVAVVSMGYVQGTRDKSNDFTLSTSRATTVASQLKADKLRGKYFVSGRGVAKEQGAKARKVMVTISYKTK